MKKYLLLCLISLVIIFFKVHPVWADMDPPPIYAQGGILQTNSEGTNVTMVHEEVLLKYGAPLIDQDSGPVMPVYVTAEFQMRNTSSKAETMNVYFPARDSEYLGYGQTIANDMMKNFTVGGLKLDQDDLTYLTASIGGFQEIVSVYQWQETFQPGEIRTIAISYDAKSAKNMGVYQLTYVLGTGRGWKGAIGSGTVTFQFLHTLTDYSVVDPAPQLPKNPLAYTVDDHGITISFSNYEPEPDTVITLGVYDLGIVEEIEALQNKADNFENTLSIAGAFNSLSGGPHCSFCTGKAAAQAITYYTNAISQATTQDQLDRTLASFIFGDARYVDWVIPDVAAAKNLFAFSDCSDVDTHCRYYAYLDRGGLGESPFIFDADSPYKIKHSDFLSIYSSKIRQYDADTAGAVDRFLQEGPQAYAYNIQMFGSVSESIDVLGNGLASHVININRDWAILGLGIMILALAFGFIAVRIVL